MPYDMHCKLLFVMQQQLGWLESRNLVTVRSNESPLAQFEHTVELHYATTSELRPLQCKDHFSATPKILFQFQCISSLTNTSPLLNSLYKSPVFWKILKFQVLIEIK